MKTAYYTLTTWNESAMAAGFDRGLSGAHQAVMVREPERKARPLGGNNVIDLTAWRAADLVTPEEDQAEEQDWIDEDREEEEELQLSPVPRPRRSRRTAYVAELASTVSVAAAALAIILRVVAF